MNKKELKSMIKEIVKDCMAEILVELKLETIIENAMTRSSSDRLPLKQQLNETTQKPQVIQKSTLDIRKRLGVSDAEWKAIYSDISPDSSILKESKSQTSNPLDSAERVSEKQLSQAGLFKDYSKFL